ncbi:MAG: hypothetical protein IPN17_04805 [Deltaproteobacteria bacterium]|nr:hypothetical protein [Deltaproteobacteria bacterium]
MIITRLGLRLALGWTYANPSVAPLGSIAVQSIDGAVSPFGWLRASEHSRLGLGPIVRVGWTSMSGQPDRTTTRTTTASGWWVTPGVRVGWQWSPSQALGLTAGVEAGWVLPGMEVVARTREACGSEVQVAPSGCGEPVDALAVRGPWLRLGLGASWGP